MSGTECVMGVVMLCQGKEALLLDFPAPIDTTNQSLPLVLSSAHYLHVIHASPQTLTHASMLGLLRWHVLSM